MAIAPVTNAEKLKEVEREIAMRNRVYPWMIRKGKVTKEKAAEQLRIMNAVAEDYRQKVNVGPLFEDRP